MKKEYFLVLALLFVFSCGDSKDNNNNNYNPAKPPILTSISPTSAVTHKSSFTLTCTGSNISNSCKIVFNGQQKQTQLIGETQLSCTIEPEDTYIEDVSKPATVEVYIEGPPDPGSASGAGLASNKLSFTIKNNYTFSVPKLITTYTSRQAAYMKIDNKGNLFLFFTGILKDSNNWSSYMMKSQDGGDTWNLKKIDDIDYSYWINVRDDLLSIVYQAQNGFLMFTKSLDGGETWSSPRLAGGDKIGYPNIPIRHAWGKNGSIAVLFNPPPDYETMYFINSQDSGNSWSSSAFLSDGRNVHCYENLDTDDAGNFYFVFDKYNPRNWWEILFSKSIDNGISWSTPTFIGGGCTPVLRWANNILFVMKQGPLALLTSIDSGKSWSAERTIPDERLVEIDDFEVDRNNNVNTAIMGQRHSFGGMVDGIYFCRTTDEGIQWTSPIDIAGGPGIYDIPQIEISSDGTIYFIWSVFDQPLPGPPDWENINISVYFIKSTD